MNIFVKMAYALGYKMAAGYDPLIRSWKSALIPVGAGAAVGGPAGWFLPERLGAEPGERGRGALRGALWGAATGVGQAAGYSGLYALARKLRAHPAVADLAGLAGIFGGGAAVGLPLGRAMHFGPAEGATGALGASIEAQRRSLRRGLVRAGMRADEAANAVDAMSDPANWEREGE